MSHTKNSHTPGPVTLVRQSDPLVVSTKYHCDASVKPQPYEHVTSPSATLPYYTLITQDINLCRDFYEDYKHLPYCRISAHQHMEKLDMMGDIPVRTYYVEYKLLYHRRDGWLSEPVDNMI